MLLPINVQQIHENILILNLPYLYLPRDPYELIVKISELSNLHTLNISDNILNDECAKLISKLFNLKNLNISRN